MAGQPNKGKGKYSEIDKKVIWGSRAHNGWQHCQGCGTTKVRHKGGGLCLHCYDKQRAKYKPQRRENLKKNHDRWYKKVKGTSEYISYTNERAKHWRDNSTAYQVYLGKRYYISRIERFLKSGRKYKNRVKILCDCCGLETPTPFRGKELEDNQIPFAYFKKRIKELHLAAQPNKSIRRN